MTALTLSPFDAFAPHAPQTLHAGDRRSRDMPRLLMAITVLSLVDLGVTLGFMTTVGMYEANPLVSLLTRCAYPAAAIVLLKLVSTGVSVGILHWLRDTGSARLVAWLLLGVLAWLMVHWVRYSVVVSAVGPIGLENVTGANGWVSL